MYLPTRRRASRERETRHFSSVHPVPRAVATTNAPACSSQSRFVRYDATTDRAVLTGTTKPVACFIGKKCATQPAGTGQKRAKQGRARQVCQTFAVSRVQKRWIKNKRPYSKSPHSQLRVHRLPVLLLSGARRPKTKNASAVACWWRFGAVGVQGCPLASRAADRDKPIRRALLTNAVVSIQL